MEGIQIMTLRFDHTLLPTETKTVVFLLIQNSHPYLVLELGYNEFI